MSKATSTFKWAIVIAQGFFHLPFSEHAIIPRNLTMPFKGFQEFFLIHGYSPTLAFSSL
jgi:hypothetical protein